MVSLILDGGLTDCTRPRCRSKPSSITRNFDERKGEGAKGFRIKGLCGLGSGLEDKKKGRLVGRPSDLRLRFKHRRFESRSCRRLFLAEGEAEELKQADEDVVDRNKQRHGRADVVALATADDLLGLK